MIRRVLRAAATPFVVAATPGPVVDRVARRLLDAPRRLPGEDGLGPAIDALGGEVVRLRSRDGIRLTGRWLPVDRAAPPAPVAADGATAAPAAAWSPDPHEAVLLLHGWSGSIAPDLLEYAPFLRRTAAVLGLDFRGHGGSDDAPTSFGLHEVEDVAGALAWLGERGVTRAALMGTSMGAITAIAATVVLGDGRLPSADLDPDGPAAAVGPPRPRIVGVVADSASPELEIVVASRIRAPLSRLIAARVFGRAARTLGGDPRETEPIRMVGLLEDVPLLLVHGAADRTVPIRDGRRLAAAAPPRTRHLVVQGAGHSAPHASDPELYEREVTAFLRAALEGARS